jgi:hypothetical protein
MKKQNILLQWGTIALAFLVLGLHALTCKQSCTQENSDQTVAIAGNRDSPNQNIALIQLIGAGLPDGTDIAILIADAGFSLKILTVKTSPKIK